MQEINRKRIEILNKRVEKFKKIRENCEVIDAQCAAVEDVLGLIRDQSVTMRDPQQLSDHLEGLVHDVEQTEETVREVENIFENVPDLSGLGPEGIAPLPSDSGSRQQQRAAQPGRGTKPYVSSTITPRACPNGRRSLSEKYYSRTLSVFVLYGNVRDLVPLDRGGTIEYVPLLTFLNRALFGRRDLVLTYDRGGGLSFAQPDMQADFRNALSGYDSFHQTNYAQSLPRNPDGVLNILDNYLRLRIADGKKIALIIDFAETIAPAGDVSGMSADDRNALVILKRWAQNHVISARRRHHLPDCRKPDRTESGNRAESGSGFHSDSAAGGKREAGVHSRAIEFVAFAGGFRRDRRQSR